MARASRRRRGPHRRCRAKAQRCGRSGRASPRPAAAISRKPMRPARNASTAISLAAFSTVGAAAARRQAPGAASRNAGKRSSSGASKDERADARQDRAARSALACGRARQGCRRWACACRAAHLRQHRAVAIIDEAVHDGLRVDQDVEPLGRRPRTDDAPRSARAPCSSASPNRW